MKFILIACLFLIASCGKDLAPTPQPTPVPNPIDPSEPQVMLGSTAISGQTYLWSPADGLNDPKAAMPMAAPKKTTLYTVTVISPCGTAKSSALVHVFKVGPNGELIEVK